MREYSEARLVLSELDEKEIAPDNWVERIAHSIKTGAKTANVTLTVRVPQRYFIRANLLCKAVEKAVEVAQPNVRFSFNQSNLIEYLMDEIEERYTLKPNPVKFYGNLRFLVKLPKVIEFYEEKREPLRKLKVKLDRELAHNLEILIMDLDEIQTKEEELYTVERLIELSYTNYISDLYDGKGENYVTAIMKYLGY